MTFDGVAAVEARIAQIQALISGRIAAVTASSGATASAPASSAAGSPEFASLLADAMATGTSGSDPLGQLTGRASGAGGLGGATAGAGADGGTGSVLAQLTQLAQLAQLPSKSAMTGPTSGPNAIAQQFLSQALAERGKPYVYGATAAISDANPKAFDCSELTKWAAERVGANLPDGATAQYLYVRDHGTTMPVQQALETPGALLFHFSSVPTDLGHLPAEGHVAISVGDGMHTIEARGRNYGTNVFDNAAGRGFNFAGMIPGMT